MNSIQNYIIDNDTTNALHYLGEFSKLIRQTLENASEKLMPLETEIRFLESYMNVQKMRFDKVTTSIKMDHSVDKYRTLLPPLILQPFIENAFEHAFENDSDKHQTIDIHFYLEHNQLICTIRDNGIGFDEGASNSFHKSFGQKLTKDRLDLLNREFETRDFNYEITNLKTVDSNLSGTEVRITFLLLLE
jgi:sensor histidine kinase YesM